MSATSAERRFWFGFGEGLGPRSREVADIFCPDFVASKKFRDDSCLMLASAFRYNSGMKNAARHRIVAVLTAGIFALSAAPAWAKSAKEVFAEVAGSVVVVLALDSSGETQAQGSGVVVGKNEVATNCHVIDEAESVVVRQAADSDGGQTYRMDARILARDGERDLCLLFVGELSAPPAAPVAKMGSAKELSVGEEVFAIGAPEGWELSMSRGIVSQLRDFYGKRAAPLVQTDAAISPGSSGGGLFNENAELVGITTFKWKGENLNFAIPVEWVRDLRGQGQSKQEQPKLGMKKRRECAANPDYECVMAIALPIARSIDDGDSRAWALSDIALAQAKAGDEQSMRDTFAAALSATRSITDRDFFDEINRDVILRVIVGAQAEAGDMGGAFALARSADARDRDVFLGIIAEARARKGDIDGALAIIRMMRVGDNIDGALGAVASARAETGDMDGARAIARNIDQVDARVNALSNIASALAKAGDKRSARHTFAIALRKARGGYSAHSRARAFRDIAEAQAETGDMSGAFATIQNIGVVNYYVDALGRIASAQAKAGDTRSARDTFAIALLVAGEIDAAHRRVNALRVVAEAQADAGDFQRAMKTAMGIEEDDIRARALAAVAKHLAARERN